MSGINIEACNTVERDDLSLPLLPFSILALSLSLMFGSLRWLVVSRLRFSIPCAGVIERDSLLARKQPQIQYQTK